MFLTGIEEKKMALYVILIRNYLLSRNLMLIVSDRVILAVGFFLFSCAVLYVVSKRIGVLALQRKVTAALKAGMAGKGAIEARGY